MSSKYYNDAIIGNRKVTVSYNSKGELIRFYYPNVGYKQFVDFHHVGIKVNESNFMDLHNDENNIYEQFYIEKTNILNTDIMNKTYNLYIKQTNFVLMNENLLVERYQVKNNSSQELKLNFLINSKLISNNDNVFGSKVIDNGILQYNHNYNVCTFSNLKLLSHQLNNVSKNIESGIINDNDYIGMSPDVAISYDLEYLKPGEVKDINIYIYVEDNKKDITQDFIEDKVEKIRKYDVSKEESKVKKYWQKFVQEHSQLKGLSGKINKIYIRSILLLPLLIDYKIGGIAAALEIDENKEKSGGYSYCWTRDAVYVTKALDKIKMNKECEKFYKVFCPNTQNKEGMWEQRFFANGNLAPCWGYQIDETASVVYGTYQHYLETKDEKFLRDTLKMCEKACKFLTKYINNALNINDEEDVVKKEIEQKYQSHLQVYKKPSYDLWEMKEGIHLYSLSSIYAAFESMIEIYKVIKEFYKENRIKIENINNVSIKLDNYKRIIKKYILDNMYEKEEKILYRNTDDKLMDVSIVGSVIPFNVFNAKEKKIMNTVEKLEMTLRTYTGGFLRVEQDNYIGGKNPWSITTLWMAMYYKQIGQTEKAKQCLDFVVNTASKNGFIAEQINNETMKPEWVIGLAWAHSMFIILLDEM